jgi:hypothetical protein
MLTFQARGHQNALFCMQIFKKNPIAGEGTPSLHPPPTRPSAVRVRASRPRLRGPKRRNLNPSEIFFCIRPWMILMKVYQEFLAVCLMINACVARRMQPLSHLYLPE